MKEAVSLPVLSSLRHSIRGFHQRLWYTALRHRTYHNDIVYLTLPCDVLLFRFLIKLLCTFYLHRFPAAFQFAASTTCHNEFCSTLVTNVPFSRLTCHFCALHMVISGRCINSKMSIRNLPNIYGIKNAKPIRNSPVFDGISDTHRQGFRNPINLRQLKPLQLNEFQFRRYDHSGFGH